MAAIPPSWLAGDRDFESEAAHRAAYVDWLRSRREAIPVFLEEAERARALLV